MKKIELNVIKYFLAAIVISLAACKGDKGDVGPTGATGATGQAGSPNVTNYAVSVYPGTWHAGTGYYYAIALTPALTDATKDIVLVYATPDGGANWWQWPMSNFRYAGDEVEFTFRNGQVYLNYVYTSEPTTQWDFHIVIIPPSAADPDDVKRLVNVHDYNAVKSAFNLKD